MIDRYSHRISDYFTDQAKIDHWCYLTSAYTALAMSPQSLAVPIDMFMGIEIKAVEVHKREDHYGHDVVAFLACYLDACPAEARPYVHLGLTSSDLVEYSHHTALRDTLLDVEMLLGRLRKVLLNQPIGLRRGQTHGQTAEPNTWMGRCMVWESTVSSIKLDIGLLKPRLAVMKSPGPTGQSPLRAADAVTIAENRRLAVVPSTQVIPRDRTVAWAALLLRACLLVEDIATSIWTSSQFDRGEMMEGGAEHRVGSSSMPHKRNPIRCEQLRGLARVARGHFSTIAENYTLFDDRDISNSSVERLSVPDLATLTGYMLDSMIDVLKELQVREDSMAVNLGLDWDEAVSATLQYAVQKVCKLDALHASSWIRSIDEGKDRDGVQSLPLAVADEIRMQFGTDLADEFGQTVRRLTGMWFEQMKRVLEIEAPA